jgi:hypothetical protein
MASIMWPMNQSDKDSDNSADNILMIMQKADKNLLHERTPPDTHTCAMKQVLLILRDYVKSHFSHSFWKLSHHHIVLLWLCVMAT